MRFLLSVILLLSVAVLRAGTVTAAGTSVAQVQAAINSASSGDTVVVPAGSATWASGVTISSKALTLQGTSTAITCPTGEVTAITVTCNASNFVQVTGFAFTYASASGNYPAVALTGSNSHGTYEVGFRLDHCTFSMGAQRRAVVAESIFGLIDHCTFTGAASGSIHALDVNGSSIGSDGGYTPWTWPLTLGTDKAVYVEDCTFDYSYAGSDGDDAIDGYCGGRVAIRHCTFTNNSVGFHGCDSGYQVGMHSFEVYSNVFNNSSGNGKRYGTCRSGTGVWHHNTYGGTTTWNGITLQYYRSNATQGSDLSWGLCDGRALKLTSADYSDGGSRTTSTSGTIYFNNTDKQTLGSGTGYTTPFDIATPGDRYPGRNQPGRTTGQVLAPVYSWSQTDTTAGGVKATGTWAGGLTADENNLAYFIQANREWYDNTPMPGYTEYTYPHPLQSSGGGTTTPDKWVRGSAKPSLTAAGF